MNILSIQSRVAYGHVGNAAAMFPLQRLGFDVWPIDTVSYSNHLGYATWTGRTPDPAEAWAILDGLDRLGVLARCDAVLSGYLGAAGNGAMVLDAVARVRAANPRAIYACDPVMGDRHCGLFVQPDIPPIFIGGLAAAADIALPNAFELEILTGGGTATLADALAAADQLRRAGPTVVVVTSLKREDGPADQVEVLAVGREAAWLATTPMLPGPAHGAGDAFAALFLGHYLRDPTLEAALARALSGIYAVIEVSAEAGTAEIQLVAAQDQLDPAAPRFRPVRVR